MARLSRYHGGVRGPQATSPRLLPAMLAAALLLLPAIPVQADFYAGLDAYRAGDFEKALAEWLPLAGAGDLEATYRIGRLYARGRGVAQDDTVAVEWFRKAARQGYAPAQNDLGTMYEQGRGVERDDVQAVRWFRAAAESGRAAAQANLATMYELGRGVAADDGAAFRWYALAAEQENPAAQNNLGRMYEEGRGVAASEESAYRWYRRAARQDHPAAQYNLGRMYEFGHGTAANRTKATKWYSRAADAGVADAQAQLDAMHVASRTTAGTAAASASIAVAATAEESLDDAPPPDGRPDPEPLDSRTATTARGAKSSRDIDEPPARRELRQRAESGDLDAQYEMGTIYATGRGLAPDIVEGGGWYIRAAEGGHAMAAYRLAFLYLRGRGVAERPDYVAAHTWFSVAEAHGITDASNWRTKIERKMSPDEIAESAERVAALD